MDRNYQALKFDPFGSGDLELDRAEMDRSIDLIEAVHAVTGTRTQILLEMHGRFAPHQAVAIARAVEGLNIGWIEEPCRPEDLDALAYVAAHTSIPIATGERLYSAQQYRELFKRRACHIIQPDINQCGGLLEVKKICSTAETHSLMVAPHNVGGIVSTTAALHLIVGLRNGKILEHFNDFADAEMKQCGKPYPEVKDGYFSLPQGPGWGLELDEAFIRKHAPQQKDGVVSDPSLDMFRNPDWHRRDGKPGA